MKVCLLNPKRSRGISYTIIPNIGLGYLAKVLRRQGHDPFIVDANRDGLDHEKFGRIIGKEKPAWIGITTFSSFIASVRQDALVARLAHPETKIVLGGPHPTFEPKETLDSIPEADFVVMCEGEPAVGALCSHLQAGRPNLSEIPNLAWRTKQGIRKNDVEIVKNLDGLGMPDWDALEPHKFPLAPNGIFSKAPTVAPVIATRGCPHSCTFCGAGKAMGKKLRTRSAQNVFEEILLLREKFGIREIHFMDDNFTQNRRFVVELCEKIIQSNLQIHWACPNGVRLDRIDAKLARQMERAGCYSLAVGIEFGTDQMLSAVKKGMTIERIRSQIDLLKKETDMKLTGFFMLGHPEENEEQAKKTIDYALELPLDRANFFNFTPFPGSRLYDLLKEGGDLKSIDMEKLYIHSIAYHPRNISARKLARLQRFAHLRFYLRLHIILGLLREIKGWTQVRVLFVRAWHLILGR